MSDVHTLDYVINVDSGSAYNDLRKLEITLIRIGSIIKRMSGDENITNAINMMNRLVWAVRTAEIAIKAFMLASGPIGWAYAGVTALSSAVMIGQGLAELAPETTSLKWGREVTYSTRGT